jgi:secreted protein with Ig-like and vWFA domain/capsular polysaccharide biosynthesis protein
MKDSTPFDTIGDGPLEARIVAWVLGEASAFEAAELGRLCDERPELEIFRRRLLALHGLLAEATITGPDEAWKLPPEKRKPLDELFGVEQASVPAADPEVRIRRSGRRALLAIAACVVFSLAVFHFLPRGYESEAIIEIKPSLVANSPLAGSAAGNSGKLTPQFFGTEVEKIKSRHMLSNVVDNLELESRWGVNKETAVQTLKDSIKTKNIPGTDLISIRVRNANEEDAKNITKEVARAYKDYRTEIESRYADLQLAELAKAIREQEDKVEERRKVLSTITRTRTIIYKGQDSFDDSSENREESIRRGLDAQDYADAKRDFESDQQLLQAMKLKQVELSVEQSALSTSDAASPSQELAKMKQSPQKRRSPIPASPTSRSERARAIPPPAAPAQPAEIAAASGDFISPVAGTHVDGLPADADSLASNEVTSGLRSGDQAINRNNIDAILNNPNRAAEAQAATAMNGSDAAGRAAGWSSGVPEQQAAIRSNPALTFEPMQNANLGRELSVPATPIPAPAEPPISMEPALESESQLAKNRDGIEIHAGKSSSYLFRAKDLRSPLESMEEITAAAEPYSTFSLNISDASFQVAKAALEKGERPDPASIKTEQFYNAVDYGDSSPAADEPVTAFVEQSGHPIIPGRNLVRVSLKTAAAGRGASQPLRLTLLVDQSGSMVREDRRAAMTNALKQLGGLLTPADHLNVVGFSRSPRLLADNLTGDQSAKLPDLINQTASEGGTNLEEALKLGEQMAVRHQAPGEQNRIVLFTDGAANLGNADPERLAIRIKALRQNGIAFDIAGIGADGLNDRLLAELARHGNGRYYVVDDKSDSFARQLAGAFRPAAENVKVQVRFNPERVGNYKLIGFEKDRLKTEDFRNDAVDAAELAAEEAGVAIYQVETLPEGTGEIGEVSVRFRDTAKGEMVERKWTMPFESNTLPFDLATPSMQLAGLSMLAAEKLKGGPLADAIDFKQLAGPQATVRQFYGSSPRVAGMLDVIDKLK